MSKQSRRIIGALAVLVAVVGVVGTRARPQAPAGIDTAAIDRVMGRAGQALAGDVYRVAFPRTDLTVTVNEVRVLPGFALGSWAAFKATPGGAVVHGDLVLLHDELNPVISVLQAHDIEITGVHNHLLHESPAVIYVHYFGQGGATALAEAVKEALGRSKTPLAPPTAPAAAPGTAVEELPVEAIQQGIGLRGTVTNGVLSMAQPRPEAIQMMGIVLPPSMGMATAINFQPAGGGKVAATGDFVMLAEEVNKVARALRDHDIEITALHNHMLHSTPELYFMHFWAVGDATKISTGLKAALAELKK